MQTTISSLSLNSQKGKRKKKVKKRRIKKIEGRMIFFFAEPAIFAPSHSLLPRIRRHHNTNNLQTFFFLSSPSNHRRWISISLFKLRHHPSHPSKRLDPPPTKLTSRSFHNPVIQNEQSTTVYLHETGTTTQDQQHMQQSLLNSRFNAIYFIESCSDIAISASVCI